MSEPPVHPRGSWPPGWRTRCVYKFALAEHEPRIKVSENIIKITLPGRKQVHRYFDSNGMLFGADGIACVDGAAPE